MSKANTLKEVQNQICENELLISLASRLYSPPGFSVISGLKLGDPKKVSKLEEMGEYAIALDLLIRSSPTTLLFLFFDRDIQVIIRNELSAYLKSFKTIVMDDDHHHLTRVYNTWKKDDKCIEDFGWILRKKRREIICAWIDILRHRPGSMVTRVFKFSSFVLAVMIFEY